jgi:hypothetical protein
MIYLGLLVLVIKTCVLMDEGNEDESVSNNCTSSKRERQYFWLNRRELTKAAIDRDVTKYRHLGVSASVILHSGHATETMFKSTDELTTIQLNPWGRYDVHSITYS